MPPSEISCTVARDGSVVRDCAVISGCAVAETAGGVLKGLLLPGPLLPGPGAANSAAGSGAGHALVPGAPGLAELRNRAAHTVSVPGVR